MENICAFKCFARDDDYELRDQLDPNIWDDDGKKEYVKPGRFVLKDTLTGKEYDIMRVNDAMEGTPRFFRLSDGEDSNILSDGSIRIDL